MTSRHNLLLLIVATILMACGSMPYAAQNELSEKAAKAYHDKKYNEALALYRQAESEQGVSAQLYYNLGNTYYRLGNRSQAILHYERALKLSPSFTAARDNLHFVKEKNVIRDEGEETFFAAGAGAVARLMDSNGWATTALLLFLATIALALCYAFASAVRWRKCGFFGGIVTLALCGVAVACALSHYHTAHSRQAAIVTTQQATFGKGPREIADSNDVAFTLPEGYRVKVTDSVLSGTDSLATRWYKVMTFDGNVGWSDNKQITII